MFARRTLVLMLALSMALFVFGCGGKEAMDTTDTGMDDDTPVISDPVIEDKPVIEDDTEPTDMGTPVLNDVFFAFDKHNLTGESRGILEQDARELRSNEVRIVIEGHCDERGTKSYNLALGEKRAKAAKDYLVSLGIASSRITTVSYGKERPFSMGHNEAAWAKNRRAHLVVK